MACNRSHDALVRWGSVLGLLVLFAQLALAAPRLSLTYDEPLYTAIGYSDLVTGDFQWHGVIGHGPLINMMAAWPLLLAQQRPDPRQVQGWGSNDSLGFSRDLLSELGDLAAVALVTRIPIMWLTLVLAACVGRWAGQVWGRTAGLVALLAFTWEPNLLAHGQLNTTDMGVTAFGTLGVYLLWRYLRHPSRLRYVGAGLALGCAVASKTSGHFWLGVYGMTALVACLRDVARRADRRAAFHSLWQWGTRLVGWVGLGLIVLWASYGFELRPLADGGTPVPLASHWLGLRYQRANVTEGQVTYLAGELLTGGNLLYFPLAFALKTPLPMLAMLLLSAGLAYRRPRAPWLLVATPLAYGALSLFVGLNIGYRHLLPVVPFVCLWIGRLAAPGVLPLMPAGRTVIIVPLLIWHLVGSAGMFPHYLAYFNELAGGPEGGRHYFADSTLEWGQGLRELATYLEVKSATGSSVEEVKLAAFSSLDPAWYGLEFEALPPTPGEGVPLSLARRFDPEPGRYVLSVTALQGLWLLDPDTYDWFRHQTPTVCVGHVLCVYDVPSNLPRPTRVVECATPHPPIAGTDLVEGLGTEDLDIAYFDCERSWLYPAAGAWVVLPNAGSQDTWVSERVTALALTYCQRGHWSHLPAALYRQSHLPAGAQADQVVIMVAPSELAPAQAITEGATLSAPVSLEGPLTFVGYRVHMADAELIVESYWQVDDAPDRPLSLMAHLLDANGRPVFVADGLGVPIEGWRFGDVIVQRHAFGPVSGGPYMIQLGAYWLDTLERWRVVSGDQVLGDRLLVPQTLMVPH